MNRKTNVLAVLLFLTGTAASCSTPAASPELPAELDVATSTPVEIVIPTVTKVAPQPSPSLQQATPAQPTRQPQPGSNPTPTLFPEKVLHTVTDVNGAIEAVLPEAWSDMRSEPWVNKENQVIGTTFLVAANIDEFLNLKAEGVSISVSNRLGKGYIQLLDEETKSYKKICADTYKTTWTLENPVYKGKYVVLGCSSRPDSWLSVFSMVNKKQPDAYVARVIALDMVPTYGDQFRDIILQFKVFPENLP